MKRELKYIDIEKNLKNLQGLFQMFLKTLPNLKILVKEKEED